MYKVVSVISSIPYGIRSYKTGNEIEGKLTEWFKGGDNGLTGFNNAEATQLKIFLDKHTTKYYSSNTIEPLSPNEVPHVGRYEMPDNDLPLLYPFEDLLRYTNVRNNFSFEIFGYHRFLKP